MQDLQPIPVAPSGATPAPTGQKLHAQAVQLEAAFLSEMLKCAQVGRPMESFGGGIGEEQFASFLRDAYSEKMAEKGGIGLAESIFHALTRGQGNV
ncbi:hypothetical protein EOW65_16340 [Sinirhodobacter ferrireducens]|uniref:Flagellar protein FlgJ N-terminal domain-containing protein n=1 Tax=Paenirhodobacter ferrireducens TaxID=1215032 RepID=A0A443L849_9RHOB|nr:rod-binding protein [Sinirhodobacter ferrireducens]RWR45407.1 hypothetical protein EOW65_16340 [Sinirhodobacter ferrireducens]